MSTVKIKLSATGKIRLEVLCTAHEVQLTWENGAHVYQEEDGCVQFDTSFMSCPRAGVGDLDNCQEYWAAYVEVQL